MTARRTLLLVVVLGLVSAVTLSGCDRGETAGTEVKAVAAEDALPDSAYYVQPDLEKWVDPETGYDTTRDWKMDDSTWPVGLIMSPSQSPQLILGEQEGLYSKALGAVGIKPRIEKIELPPRTFHALQRSKWPFVYMPYAVFTDYSRTNRNQGGAGGLQYVALAGSTAGGGYTLVTKDPTIRTVADLRGKTAAGLENNPARIVLIEAAAKKAGLRVGDGPDDIHAQNGESAQDLNDYMSGKYDALIVLSIVRERFLATGSHALTDFTDVGYTPNYTILTVERSVLEQRPDVVKAFLEAHYAANALAEQTPPEELNRALMESWNGYFRSQDTSVAAQRIVPDEAAFARLLGNMRPEQRIDPALLEDCFSYLEENEKWEWGGSVDWRRLLRLDLYDEVLRSKGKAPQTTD